MPDIRSFLLTEAGGLVVALLATVAVTAILVPIRSDMQPLNEGLLLLLLTLLASASWGLRVGVFTAVITNLSLNFFFIEPLHTFAVQEPRSVFGLAIFIGVSLVGGSLLSVSRRMAAEARRHQAETEVVLSLSRAMSGQPTPAAALEALCREVVSAFSSPGAAVLTGSGNSWSLLAHAGSGDSLRLPSQEERVLAERACREGEIQGVGDAGLPRSRARIVIPRGRRAAFERERGIALVPLVAGDRVLGVLRLDGPFGDSPFRARPYRLLNAVAGEAALAVQRVELARAAAQTEALQQADEMKTALISSISHDLKTPLATIKAAISNLLDERISWSAPDVRSFLTTIDAQSERLNRIIGDILDFNRIESGSLVPDRSPVTARELLERARDATAFESAGRRVTVEASPDLSVVTDEALIVQALVNLVENAIKYSSAAGPIRLRAQARDGRVVLSVQDAGPGIAAADLPHVFEQSFRASEHSRRVTGSGLGLTIVKRFVELCGGEAGVESSPSGTTFSITLAAAKPDRVPA